MFFRACDRRYPFLWATDAQPRGRWHDVGEGPCHYLATTPKGAWAEVVRHECIRDVADLEDLELALWWVRAPRPADVPVLDIGVLTGDETSYPACRAEARRLRTGGALGLVALSAPLISGEAELYGVDTSGQCVTNRVPTEAIALFGPPTGIVGEPAAEGHPNASILDGIRHL